MIWECGTLVGDISVFIGLKNKTLQEVMIKNLLPLVSYAVFVINTVIGLLFVCKFFISYMSVARYVADIIFLLV